MVGIVVPIYKTQLSSTEKVSYMQLQNVLGDREIIFVIPESLKIQFNCNRLKYISFDDRYFKGTDTYNELLLSKHFYEAFLNYEYILIYQLDALVFEDKLNAFCNLGYDYIGAPWIGGYSDYYHWGRKVIYVGNGGLSLRKVKSCLKALEAYPEKIYKGINEDLFFSVCGGGAFRVAPREIALQFAFEREVKRCFRENHNRIPFGCHAWERYDPDFWIDVLAKQGYSIDIKESELRGEDLCSQEMYRRLERTASLLKEDKFFYSLKDKLASFWKQDEAKGYTIWGTGQVANSISKMFEDLLIPVQNYIDTNVVKQGKTYRGKIINAPRQLDKGAKIIVAVSEKYCTEIGEYLEQRGFRRFENYLLWNDVLADL